MGQYYAAADVGATGVKVTAASFDGTRLTIKKTYSRKNPPLTAGGHLYTDVDGILRAVAEGLASFRDCGDCCGFGIDTYGNGYGILDRGGVLMDWPHYYRDRRIDGVLDQIHEIYTDKQLYESTGNYPVKTRSLFHLYCDVLEKSPQIAGGEMLLPLSNLFEYLMTGEAGAEYSIASVLYMLDAEGKKWNDPVFRRLGIPTRLFPALSEAGGRKGRFSKEFAARAGCGRVPVAGVLGHDTESAVLAAPGLNEEKAFLSLGTSFIMGVQRPSPLISGTSFRYRFKNMRGAFGNYSLCRDFPGFWILERCMEEWRKDCPNLDYDDVCAAAEAAGENHSFINVSDDIFRVSGACVCEEIREYCRRTGQRVVDGMGETARCLFESYGLQVRWCLEKLEQMTGKAYSELTAVGGGVRNTFLMQMLADASGLTVAAGSPVASSLGNILMQLYAAGEAESPEELRDIACASSSVKTYESRCSPRWEEGLQYMKQKGLFEEER